MVTRAEILAQMKALVAAARDLSDPGLLAELRALLEPQKAPEVDVEQGFEDLLGRSPPMLALRADIRKFAATTMPVLLLGESGTGKELVARALHRLSPRHAGPLVSENCAAIPESLLESVLFGHSKGSFTGAIKDHAGHFVAAHGGTLFLDEVGDMPLPMQVKLLRALQEGEVRAIGATKARKVDVRVVAATNRDLEAMVAAGKFREDLYYRLNVLRLRLPPLRERGEDILLLARHFLARACAGRAGGPLRLSAAAEKALGQRRWDGNVRELINEMQRVAALAAGPEVEVKDLSAKA